MLGVGCYLSLAEVSFEEMLGTPVYYLYMIGYTLSIGMGIWSGFVYMKNQSFDEIKKFLIGIIIIVSASTIVHGFYKKAGLERATINKQYFQE